MRPKKIVIIQRTLKYYRVAFYEKLRSKCRNHGIDLSLIYGSDDTLSFNDADIDWAIKIPNRRIRIGNKSLYWQPCLKHLKNADLIVVEQANKLLVNYVLWVLHLAKIKKLSFWGHGKNFQARDQNSIPERIKQLMSQKVHWWFVYNDLSAEVVKALGFPGHRITIVNNAIDTEEIIQIKNSISDKEIIAFKQKYGINSDNIGLFVGGMYPEKKLGFLLKSASLIRENIKDFEIVFVGAGQDQSLIEKFVAENKWAHYLGPMFGREKILSFAVSKFLLIPGLVGLAILDAFALGVPLITTNFKYHSPEIDYLKNDLNGIMVDYSIEEYAATVSDLLKNDERRAKLVRGCVESAKYYTIERMVDNFLQGARKAVS